MSSQRKSLSNYVNWRMRVTLLDGRQLVGRFMAFDRHMNIVLGDAEEFRRLPPKKGVAEADRNVRRPLGLALVRGEEVISLTIEGPPPTDDRRGKKEVAPVRAPRESRPACPSLGLLAASDGGTLTHPLSQAGPGSGKAAGRGIPAALPGQVPAGLAGPVRGVGGPGMAAMRPQARLCRAAARASGSAPGDAASRGSANAHSCRRFQHLLRWACLECQECLLACGRGCRRLATRAQDFRACRRLGVRPCRSAQAVLF